MEPQQEKPSLEVTGQSVLPPKKAAEMEWTDCFEKFKEHTGQMDPWGVRIVSVCRAEDIMSAPEVMDPKTDPLDNWTEHPPLEILLQKGEIPDASKFTEDAVLDIMDSLLISESMFLSGLFLSRTVYTCVYAHQLDLVKECPALYGFLGSLIKSLDYVLNVVLLAEVREDDEFNVPCADLNCLMGDADTTPISQQLNEAIATTKNSAIAERLKFRSAYWKMLEAFEKGTWEAAQEARSHAEATLAVLKNIQRSSEPVRDPKVFFKTPGTWLNTMAPVVVHTPWAFEDSMKYMQRMIEHYIAGCDLPKHIALPALLSALEHFSESRPCLPVRSRTLTLLYRGDPNMTTLIGDTFPMRVLNTLAEVHGAPLYKQIVEGDTQLLEEVTGYGTARMGEGADPGTPEMTRMITLHWAKECAGRAFIDIMTALLHNRGRCHRCLGNLLQDLVKSQQFSYELDVRKFCSSMPYGSQVSDVSREWADRSMVLTNFINELILFCQDTYLTITMELDLLTKSELLCAIYYRNYLCSARQENAIALCIPRTESIPPKRMTRKKNVPLIAPVVTSRVFALPTATVSIRCEIVRMVANTCYTLLSALSGHELVDLRLPKTSTVTPEVLWNHRFECFQRIVRPPFQTYRQCMSQVESFASTDLLEAVKQTIDSFNACRLKVKLCREEASQASLDVATVEFLGNALKVCGRNIVALKLIREALEGAAAGEKDPIAVVREKYEMDLDYTSYPSLITFMVKLKQ